MIDLTVFIRNLIVPTFKMDMAELIRKFYLQRGMGSDSLDVTHPHTQEITKSPEISCGRPVVSVLGTCFQFCHNTSRVTCIVIEVNPMLQNGRILFHQYLDDWLLCAASQQICLHWSKQLVVFVQELGWVINLQKTELIPISTLPPPWLQI